MANPQRPSSLKSARGFTLTELAVVLAIIGLVLSGVWVAASDVYQNNKVSNAQKQILQIVNNIRTAYAEHPNFKATATTDVTTSFANANLLPAEILSPGGSSYKLTETAPTATTEPTMNAWGSVVVIYASILNQGTFRVSYYGLDSASCTQLASAVITGSSKNSGPINLVTECGVNGLSLTPTAPPSVTDIAGACAANNGAACQSVEFDYNLLAAEHTP